MNNDGVVVLHGIFRTKRSMQGLARFIESNGYQVLNMGYPSTRLPIEKLIHHIHPSIDAFSKAITGKVHFVGYSMGGLLIRAYLHQFRPLSLGRVVMLGTPNQGSEVADFLKNWRLYKALYGPAGQQLITQRGEWESILGKVDFELGVIAGNRPIDPVSSRIIGCPNDGKVSIESTKIDGMKDHVIIPVSHTFFPSNKQAWALTLRFLKTGTFSAA